MFIVVIGSAKLGLAFVGPFADEVLAEQYITAWKSRNNATTPIGHVKLLEITDPTAGAGYRWKRCNCDSLLTGRLS